MKTIKILLVEDESLAVSRLEMMLAKVMDNYLISGKATSIKEAVDIIESQEIDLGFFDIQIEDGLSLSIFERTEVKFPVIFTTAYNDYAVKAFKFNSIDYLLKPVSLDELKNAVEKFKSIWQSKPASFNSEVIEEMKQLVSGRYKDRFVVKTGSRISILKTDDVCFFYSFNKGTFAKTNKNSDLLLDNPLDLIMTVIDPSKFFRISRKHIINIDYLVDIYAYSNSRLKVNIKNQGKEELIVSREKVRSFKKWLENA